MIQVSFFTFISFIVSTNLKEQISSQLKIVKKEKEKKPIVIKPKPVALMKMNISKGDELTSLLNNSERRVKVGELVIGEGCGNELKDELKICGLDHLKKLIVKKNSLKNLDSLIISNNNELEIIDIEDGQPYDKENETYYAPFENVKIVEISSIF